ncbi:MAG: AAA family ATPase, partial [Candidatus Thiodiazotropha endolucinida]
KVCCFININPFKTVRVLSQMLGLNQSFLKLYSIRHFDNIVHKHYEDEGIPYTGKYLNDKEFEAQFGSPPWERANLILEKLSLPYKFNNPTGTTREGNFILKLIHRSLDLEINSNDLSTGEKTLISLALAMYNFTGNGDLPEIIILDEPDASLHPSMTKIMLEIIDEEIVKKQGIPVITSTHSPTTIACAPANSLYKISSHQKRPVQCNLQDSTKILSYGIPNLRVSTEQRRQIFVEHNNDVLYYEYLFDIISRVKKFPTTPHFLPPHNLNGSNCEAVLEITKKLRDMGNTQVYGLIDWDKKNKPEKQIIILGMGKRYSIENYIFEPHFLGLYLILKKFVKPEDFGLDGCNSYVEVGETIRDNDKTLQNIVNNVESRINWESNSDCVSESRLIDGTTINIRSEILTIQGHKFEDLCKNAWPKLKSIRENNNGDCTLKKDLISTVINDYPGLISVDLVKTFEEIK